MSDDTRARIDRIYREEYGRVVASLARRFGDLDIAEDAAGEALPLDGYHAWHAARADLLRRLGRGAEARAAYDAAIAATQNPAERAYLARRREHLV